MNQSGAEQDGNDRSPHKTADRLFGQFQEWRSRHPLLDSGLTFEEWWEQRVELGLVNHGAPSYRQYAWRIRDDSTALNTSGGWLGAENTAVTEEPEKVYRIRFSVAETAGNSANTSFKLQYRLNTGTWTDCGGETAWPTAAGVSQGPAPVSMSGQFADNDACSTELLNGLSTFATGGLATEGANSSGNESWSSETREWEWAITLHRLYGTADTDELDDGDVVEFRMVESDGTVLNSYLITGDVESYPKITIELDNAELVGGTFAESPNKFGPFRASNGDLYVIAEHAETNATIYVHKSTDSGASWKTLYRTGNPTNGDMEGAAAVHDQDNGVIYILHQPNAVYLHEFRTSDHATNPDTWGTVDTAVESTASGPATQRCDLELLSDGDLIAMYNFVDSSIQRIAWKKRTSGTWGSRNVFTGGGSNNLRGVSTWYDSGNQAIYFQYIRDPGGTNDALLIIGKMTSVTGTPSISGTTYTIDTGLVNSAASYLYGAANLAGYDDDGVTVVSCIWRDELETDNKIRRRTLRDDSLQTTQDDILGTNTSPDVSFGGSDQPNMCQFVRNKRTYLVYTEGTDGGPLKYTYSDDEGSWQSPTQITATSPSGSDPGIAVADALEGATVAGVFYDAGDTSGGTGQLYYDSFTIPAETAGTVSGTAAITESSDTVNGDGEVEISGTAAITENVDTANADGDVDISGTAAITELVDDVDATGYPGTDGSAAITEQSDSVNADGSVEISGTAAITELVDSVNADGTVPVSGTAAITETTDAVTATGEVEVSGTAAVSELTDSVNADGDLPISGTSAITENIDAVNADGTVEYFGSAAITELSDSVNADGSVEISGTAAITEDVDAVNADGTVEGGDISGSAAITEASDSVNADGGVEIDGSAAITELTDAVNADGEVEVSGTAAITELTDSVNADGTLEYFGSAAITELSDTINADGGVEVSGTSAITELVDTVNADGSVEVSGSAAITEVSDSVSAIGDIPIDGTAAVSELTDTVDAEGTLTSGVTGTAAITEAVDAVNADGTVEISGTAAITEDVDVVTASGGVEISGSAAIVEDSDGVAATGSAGFTPVTGSAAITELSDTAAAAGDVGKSGSANVVEARDIAAGVGDVTGALNLDIYWRYRFIRDDDTLLLIPVRNTGQTVRNADTDVASAVFRYNSWYHDYAMAKVASAWAANKTEPAATLRAAMNQALHDAGFIGERGQSLV